VGALLAAAPLKAPKPAPAQAVGTEDNEPVAA
jgi:hypothetical protein